MTDLHRMIFQQNQMKHEMRMGKIPSNAGNSLVHMMANQGMNSRPQAPILAAGTIDMSSLSTPLRPISSMKHAISPPPITTSRNAKDLEEQNDFELEEIFVGNMRNGDADKNMDAITLEDNEEFNDLFNDDDDEFSPMPIRPTVTLSRSMPNVTMHERMQDHLPAPRTPPPKSNKLALMQLLNPRLQAPMSPVRSASANYSPSATSSGCNTPMSCRSATSSPHPGDQQRFKPFHEEKWKTRLKELKEYRTEHGNCLVPHTYPKNPQLARWVKRQRRQYKLMIDGRASTMTNERLQVLNEIGFVWDSHEACWQEKIEELSAYKAKMSNCLVPSNYKKNPQLATWVKCQRRQYKLYWEGRPSAMTPDRIGKLDSIGFEWEIRQNTNSVDRSDYLMLSAAINNL